ncbi:hypothetical protein GCM10020358_05930 [Amorphoplanes nipponensis]
MVLAVSATLICELPGATGVTVSSLVSAQLLKVTKEGLTVATEVALETTESVSVVLPVRLQPFFPSPFTGVT